MRRSFRERARTPPTDGQTTAEKREGERRSAPSGKVVYAAIVSEAEDELRRASSSLFFSGLAAGLSMGFSLIGEAVLSSRLPAASWRPLVAKLGYPLGFLIVILGRQQLFTENTLTPVLPLLRDRTQSKTVNVARLWALVLSANVVGCLAIAAVVARTGLLPAEALEEVRRLGVDELAQGFGLVFLRAIFAGWLIALLVWLLPFAESGRFWVILVVTYFIGVGQFSHVVAGSVEAFAVVFTGDASLSRAILGFVVPALLGNIVGGIFLVAALSHVQVKPVARHPI
jgi:formate/nitrite transporter FocA (FNT family)